MVSTAMMGITELAAFLVSSGTYSTLAEAIAALNLVVVDGAGVAGTALAVQGGAAELVVGTVGETAIELAARAELAATGTNVTTAGIGLLEGSGGSATACGLLGVDLGIVAAAAAPLFGVSLGAAMYESNPELWTEISQKLLPFCYPGTTVIPTWAEIANDAWQCSVLKDVIDAIKEVIDEFKPAEYDVEGIEVPGGGTIHGTIFSAPHEHNGSTYGTGATFFGWVHSYKGIAFSSSNFSGASYDSQYDFYYKEYGYPAHLTDPTFYITSGTGDLHKAIATILGTVEPVEYPEGTSEWTGNVPQEIPEAKPAVINWDESTQTGTKKATVPLSFPFDVPELDPAPNKAPLNWPEELPSPKKVPSPDPQVQPDPTTVTDPQKQVQPYVQPLPIPWTITNPDQKTEPNPQQDPTKPKKPTQTIETPPIELGPSPGGLAPVPLMPGTDLPFDLSQNVGLVTVYHPTSAQLYAFERWLWVTYADATIDKIWNNPFDGIIGLFELYCTPTDVGNQTIRSGFLDSGINSAVISRYTYIDCGTLGIPEYYGNYFDYSPYSKCHVYLPFIGIQELNVDDIVGHAVNITYRIDEYNGSCIAMITVAKVTTVNGVTEEYSNTMYQFSGNCSVELPLTGGSQASIRAGMMTANAYQNAANISATGQLIGGIASTIGGALSLNAGGIGSGISQMVGAAGTQAYGQAQALSNMLSGKSTVQKSGSFGASHGALGIKTPFITVVRPKQIQVPNYEELYGFPAHKMVTVGSCTGFLRCREVHVVSSTANDQEKSMIEQLLKSGVYVTE